MNQNGSSNSHPEESLTDVDRMRIKAVQALEAMTPEERFQTLVHAGICLPDGTVHPLYKDLPRAMGR